jgi:PPOX class probable F420-dependent enzyme
MGYTDAPPGWWREFILASPARTAKLAVVRADGSPHVAPVWVDLDGDQVVFMTSADTIKGKAILRDPRVSLCWDDERPPFSFVTVAGIAATSADAGELVRWATRMGGRYMGADRAQEFGRRWSIPASVADQREAIEFHFAEALKLYNAEDAGSTFRKFGISYANLHPVREEVREAFIKAKTTNEIRNVLDYWYDDQHKWPTSQPREVLMDLIAGGAEA